MKLSIKESQYQFLVKNIENILNSKFVEDSRLICEIKVYEVDPEEKGNEIEQGLKFDIYVYFAINNMMVYNQAGFYGIRKGVEMRIKKYLSKLFGLDEHEYFIGFGVKDCNKF